MKKKSNKNPKNFYRVKLLQEFDLLKSKEAMQEVLEYVRFVREEEKELQKFKLATKHPLSEVK